MFPSCTGSVSDKNIDAFFYEYSTPKDGTGVIADDALEKFITDIGISVEDPVVLALACAANCAGQQYTYPEFKKLCNEIKVDNMQALRGKMNSVRSDMAKDASLHATVYAFTFNIYREPGMKNIESETAAALWPLIMKGQNCGFLDDWIAFVNDQDEKGIRKAIKKDEW